MMCFHENILCVVLWLCELADFVNMCVCVCVCVLFIHRFPLYGSVYGPRDVTTSRGPVDAPVPLTYLLELL